jgi:hypothetical protein
VAELPLLFGLDLGQVQDYSALAVAEQAQARGRRAYRVRHLHRWPLGTPYTAPGGKGIVEDVADLLTRAPGPPAILVVDATGCGRPVVDLFRAAQLPAGRLVPVVITSGHAAGFGIDGFWHVPKADLAGAVAVLLESRRLQIAPGLRLAPVLSQELRTFKVKVTAAGNETFESWRERDHDDLVLAVALAVWFGQRQPPPELGAGPIQLGPGRADPFGDWVPQGRTGAQGYGRGEGPEPQGWTW